MGEDGSGKKAKEKWRDQDRERDGRLLKRITRVLKLTKTAAGLLITLIVLAGIAFAGATPNLLQGGDSPNPNGSDHSDNFGHSKINHSKVDSKPIINVVLGSKNVSICRK